MTPSRPVTSCTCIAAPASAAARWSSAAGSRITAQGQVDAIETLQTLWRQSARSRVWSRCAGNRGAARLRPQLARRACRRRNTATQPRPGCASGRLACCSGSRSAMRSAHRSAAAGAPGAWTQHTSLALCLADSLVESRSFDPRDQMQRYLRWQSEGYLAATAGPQQASPDVARALATYRWRGQPMAGSHDPTGPRHGQPVALGRRGADRAGCSRGGRAGRRVLADDSPVAARRRCLPPPRGDAVRRRCTAIRRRSLRFRMRRAPAFWDARPLKHEVAIARAACQTPPSRTPLRRFRMRSASSLQVRGAVAGSDEFRARGAIPRSRGRMSLAICGALAGALAGGVHGLRGIPAGRCSTACAAASLLDQQLTRILERRARTLAAVTAAARSS